MHISPRTVRHLRELGHDVVRVDEVMDRRAPDRAILAFAEGDNRTVLTQDLDFSALVVLNGGNRPSVISLRLSYSQVERINDLLSRLLPEMESAILQGAIITVEDGRVRHRDLPIR